MPPTPVAVNGVLQLELDLASQSRKIRFWVQRSTVTADVILSYAGAGFNATGDVVGQVIWDLLKTQYHTSQTPPQWTLFEYDAGTLIPLDSGALTDNGTSAQTNKLGTVATLTFRSGNQVEVRLQMPETIHTPPQHATLATVSGDLQAIALSYTDNPDGTNISTWVSAKDGSVIFRGLFFSCDTNDEYRRARGL